MARKKRQTGISRILTHTPRLSVKHIVMLYAGLVLVSAASAAVLASARSDPEPIDPFSAEQRKSAGISLYYPVRLPAESKLDSSSLYMPTDNVYTMRITSVAEDPWSVLISQQAVPDGFDFEAFYMSFDGKTQVKTSLGEVTYGTIDGGSTQLASLVTKDDTWILVQAPRSVNQQVIEQITSDFRRSQ